MDSVERQLSNQALIEMSRQIEVLNGQLRNLRGEIDELRHELERARAQQKDQYLDLDTRLRAAEAALASAQPQVAPGSPEAEYQAAFNLLKDGKYEEAATALRDFQARVVQLLPFHVANRLKTGSKHESERRAEGKFRMEMNRCCGRTYGLRGFGREVLAMTRLGPVFLLTRAAAAGSAIALRPLLRLADRTPR